jgi:hypothetical protein
VQLYCNTMQMANVTFDGVQDAIMAEFACPAQLAHHADKISAVKHKGQSPCFKEQRKSNSAPCSATKAPHGESSIKRTRKGGKREKAHKACAAHNIVSSAFVPSAVLNHMQESHYIKAGPSSSRVEEVVEPPAPMLRTIRLFFSSLTCVCLMPSIFTYLNMSLPAGIHESLNTC